MSLNNLAILPLIQGIVIRMIIFLKVYIKSDIWEFPFSTAANCRLEQLFSKCFLTDVLVSLSHRVVIYLCR